MNKFKCIVNEIPLGGLSKNRKFIPVDKFFFASLLPQFRTNNFFRRKSLFAI